ncbi:MAG: hypothetical protein IPH72_32020 [Sandaracinaceae bacterium]|nr:hypothetical protein [Sandaracinaceae bacterium]
MNAPDHFCHVHGAVACGDNLCVMDGNCRALRIFDQRNAIIGKIDLSRLVGVDYPWFPAMTPVRNGTATITVNQQRGASPTSGHLRRLRGAPQRPLKPPGG